MMTGDRSRWAPGRKLTVLGKVPKPINLPSQRLENRGLDRDVEIVPKGTLTWGSRPAAASPNAWGTSSVSSPNTDGSSGSPVTGRPSSAGTGGLRPSTAGSDLFHDTASSAGGANSRPSSASGTLTSSQASFPENRPRSAETRPGSSHLSRFAENLSEHTSAWGQPRSGMAPPSSRTSGFMLSSGDFPTLGTEKISGSHISEDHGSQGRPKSSDFAKTEVPERLSAVTEVEANMAPGDHNAWNDGNQSSHGVCTLPYKENSQTDIQKALPYESVNMPPHQFNSWHGQPVCSPDGVLHGGGPVSGTFRPLARPPGCHSVEAFGYYSQGPAQFANSRPVASVGQTSSGYYAQGGDMFHQHQQPDSFMVSNVSMPARPGFYQGPAAYDSYYCPRPSIYGFTDSEGPGKGTTAPSGVHANPGKLSASSGLHTSVVAKELVRSDQVDAASHGKFKVLLKHHDVSEDGCPQGGKQEQVSADRQKFVVGDQHEASTQDVGWETETVNDGRSTSIKSLPREVPSQHSRNWKGKLPSGDSTSFSTSRNTDDEGIMKHPETTSSPTQQRYLITKKNAALLEKIDGLNNKVRMADGHCENENFISQEKSGRSKVVNKAEGYLPTVSPGDTLNVRPASVALDRSQAPEMGALIKEKSRDEPDGHALNLISESDILTYNKIDPQGSRKNHSQRLNRLEDEGKHGSAKSFPVVGCNRDGESSRACVITDPHSAIERKEEIPYNSNYSGTGQFAAPSMVPADRKAQRAKFKERAAQRGERLRQEEEERVREQKARALAKLEELDRRTAAPQLNLDSNGDPSACSDFQLEDLETSCALKTDAVSDRVHNSTETSVCFEPPERVEAKTPGDRSCSSSSAGDGSALSLHQALPLDKVDGGTEENVIQGHFIHGGSSGNPEQMVHERQIIRQQEKLVEHPINCEDMGDPKISDGESVHNVLVDKLLPAKERSIQNKRKNNKNSRSKSKVNHGTAPGRNLPSERTVSEASQGMDPNDMGNPPPRSEDPISHAPPQSHQEAVDGKISSSDGDTSSMKRPSIASGEQHGRVANQWKPESSKRPAKHQQTQRHGDKFQGKEAVVWAPVKPQGQNNPSEEEITQNDSTQTGNSYSGNNGQTQNAGTKIKRAEIERYVPKGAPKEIPRLENSPQPLSTITQISSSDATGEADFRNSRSEAPAGMPESVAEPATEVRSWDNNKSNRHGRMRSSWRQRNPSGSVQALHGSGEVEATPEFAIPVELPSDQCQELKPKPSEQHEQGGTKDNVVNPAISELGTVSSHKDQGVASKHRHQRHKGQSDSVAAGAHLALEDSQGGLGNTNGPGHPASEANDPGKREVSGVDNTSAGNRENKRAQWQPKSQSHAFESRGRSRSGGTRRAAPESVKPEHDFSIRGLEDSAHGYLDSDPSTQGVDGFEIRNALKQEANRGRDDPVGAANKQTWPTNDESIEAESSPSGAGHYHRQQYGPSTMRRHGQHKVWVDKRQESTYGGQSVGQEIGKPNMRSGGGGGGEKKNGPVLEYQPIGPSNNGNSSNVDELGGDTHAAGPRYREQRVQNHRRRS